MTDRRVYEREKTARETGEHAIDEKAARCQVRFDDADHGKHAACREAAQNSTRNARHRRNRTVGNRDVMLARINDRLPNLDPKRLKLIMLYADLQRVLQQMDRVADLAKRKAAAKRRA